MNEPEIGDMDEGVVERGKDAGDAENELTCSGCQRETFLPSERERERWDSSGIGQTFSNLGAERDVLGGSALDLLLGRHGCLYDCCSRWVR